MSYTPLSAAAADASWASASSYTRKGASVADAGWSSGSAARGFLATSFGVPSSPFQAYGSESTVFGTPALLMQAVGVCSTAFGLAEAVGVYQQTSGVPGTRFGAHSLGMAFSAAGWAAGGVGTPSIPLLASGWCGTAFGEHGGAQFWRQRSLPPTTKISGAFSPSDQSGVATGVAGTWFGTPFGLTISTQKINWVTRVVGFKAVSFGAPATAVNALSHARGTKITYFGRPSSASSMLGVITKFGLPRASTLGVASGQASTKIGQPTLRIVGRAIGAKAVHIGKPSSGTGFKASGRCGTAFGKHKCFRPDLYAAWPLAPKTAFGRPAASQRFNHPALGSCTTNVGNPACSLSYRVMHIPPVARFGTHLLRRSAIC